MTSWTDIHGKRVTVADRCLVVRAAPDRPDLLMKPCTIASAIPSNAYIPVENPDEWCVVSGIAPRPGKKFLSCRPHRCLMLIEPDELASGELASEKDLAPCR